MEAQNDYQIENINLLDIEPSLSKLNFKLKERSSLSEIEVDRIIEMAWEDRTPFDAIFYQFGLRESEVRNLMKKQLKFNSYKNWRRRVESCSTKHISKRNEEISRFKSSRQRIITQNKVSKR